MTDAQWQSAFELTLLSAVRMMRAAVPRMTEGGSILTITSSSVREPIERLGLSTVMRSGVAGLVKTLADELAAQQIRVNNLMPGRIDTERVAQLDAAAAQRSGKSIEEVRNASIARIPLKRLGTIDDFGAAGAFLLSPAAAYITGATLRVDGGMMRSI
jgi:3-oxoacyl-[acyl-carrier protein] reductase